MIVLVRLILIVQDHHIHVARPFAQHGIARIAPEVELTAVLRSNAQEIADHERSAVADLANECLTRNAADGLPRLFCQPTWRMGLRRSRYIGEPRTHLQHIVTATAMTVCRLHDWLEGIAPHSTSPSHFARFMKEAA
jgi:hypothetical protein